MHCLFNILNTVLYICWYYTVFKIHAHIYIMRRKYYLDWSVLCKKYFRILFQHCITKWWILFNKFYFLFAKYILQIGVKTLNLLMANIPYYIWRNAVFGNALFWNLNTKEITFFSSFHYRSFQSVLSGNRIQSKTFIFSCIFGSKKSRYFIFAGCIFTERSAK